MADHIEVQRTKEQYKKTLMARANVVGVGTGYKETRGKETAEMCVVALVRRKVPLSALRPEDLIPPEVGGIPTDVVQVGDLWALQARTDRWRPAPGGVSVGHYQISAGTLGCVVQDQESGERLILSNNHVLANSNNASPGDPILQPGPVDGGQVNDDVIATLTRFCPIDFNQAPGACGLAQMFADLGNALAQLAGSKHRIQALQIDPEATNLVDAAVARPVDDNMIVDDILEIGAVTGTTLPVLGMAVRKSGRTTELTTGTITVLDATVNVNYGPNQVAQFENQILTGPMSQGGDSGSVLVDDGSPLLVGLLFAGSAQVTIYNPIQAVFDCLGVTL